MRTRKQRVREAVRNTQRIQKALEDANMKLSGVVRNMLGTKRPRRASRSTSPLFARASRF